MITKKDLGQLRKDIGKDIIDSANKLRKEFKEDIEEVVAKFADTMVKMFGMVDTKEELREVKEEILEVKSDVKDLKRQINDLKADTSIPQEFANHDKRITNLETAVIPQ